MDTNRLTNATARIAGGAVAVLLAVTAAAVPAQATAVTGTAATTWAQLMRRKLDLDARSVQLTAQLPVLRTTVNTRTTELTQAQQTASTAATNLTTATAADQTARTAWATARTAAAKAKAAVATAQKIRPRSTARITRATRLLAAADTAVRTRAAAVAQTANALTIAQTANTAAANQVTASTTALRAANKAVSDTQATLAALPRTTASLLAQAGAVSAQVVTQTRAGFTAAQTTQVYGITVNNTVAYPFQRMIDAAATAGIKLSGGFRTEQQQIALRMTNGCPDIWTAPSSSCRVPTAIPGHSLHEIGLAIDMTTAGKTISDRKSPAFRWLSTHAAGYGFVNLPSEPWHWSITGN